MTDTAVKSQDVWEALAAAQAKLALMDWRPIETAPKDGTIVDLWLPGLPHPAFPEAVTIYAPDREPNCAFDTKTGRWNGFNGSDYLQIATHWMPLPEPPK